MKDKENRNVLDDRRIGLLLFKLAMPAFAGMFVTTLYNIVDTIFVGRYVGSMGIAGLTITFPLQMLCLGFGQLIGLGGASLISRLIGAGDAEGAQRALGNCMTVTALLSLLIIVVSYSNLDFWLISMGASETVLPFAREYAEIVVVGLGFQIAAIAFTGLIRAEGNARVAMIGMILAAGLNIVLDAVFIIWLDMGIRGAALATLLAELLSVVYLLGYYYLPYSYIKLRAAALAPDARTMGAIFSIGVASFARTLTASISTVVVNNVLVHYGGDHAISAFGIIIRIFMIVLLPGIVIGQGLQPILGFNYGAQRYGMSLKSIKIAMAWATGLCACVFAALYLFTEQLFLVFTADRAVLDIGTHAAKYIFLGIPMIGFVMVGSLTFQSIGKAVQAFVTSISRTVFFLIPLLLVLPRYLHLDGVWIAFPVSDAMTALLTAVLLIPQLKELVRLRREKRGESA